MTPWPTEGKLPERRFIGPVRHLAFSLGGRARGSHGSAAASDRAGRVPLDEIETILNG